MRTNTGPHPCTQCGETITGEHSWCVECRREDMRSRRGVRFERITAPTFSKPPPPPPGFDVRDFNIGRPWT